MSTDEILTSVEGGLGIITLNRPKAVNALSYNMIGLMDEALTEFEHNDAVHAVLVRGAGERGLCSGGDVVSLHDGAANNDLAQVDPFFREEYLLDHRIAVYPKPYIAIMNGLVLGGGVGIAAAGSHRVATDSTKLGMPEVGIGFSPDVGGPFYLANAPANIGNYMALTGISISGADAVYVNMADYFVADDRIDQLVQRLQGITSPIQVDDVLGEFHESTTAPLASAAHWIESAFSGDTVETIIDSVQASVDDGNELARKALAALQRNSPTGMKVALEAVRRAKTKSLAQTLVQDFRTTMNAVAGTELAEGIRAQLIDKDRNPQWSPATLQEVTETTVKNFFEPVEGVDDLVIKA